MKIYTRSNQETFPNIIMTPPDAVLSTAATGTRVTADGTASYYSNPTSELRYGIDKTKYYQGSVKLLSTNNDNTESRQVFGTGIKLTPTTTTLTNGMTRLTFDADEMIVSGYISGGWVELNRFDYGTAINLIRPIFINSERVVLQINDTKVTMLRSSPIVTLEHPNTTLTYTLRDTYTRGSGTISSPGAGADIAMTADTDYWCTIYNAASPTSQLLIGKQYKSTIKSDSLPAASKTAIGWFKNGDTGIELASSKIQQWYKQTRTGISLKQVI